MTAREIQVGGRFTLPDTGATDSTEPPRAEIFATLTDFDMSARTLTFTLDEMPQATIGDKWRLRP